MRRLLVPVAALVLLALPGAAQGATRYASPTGTGNCTSAAAACSLETAVEDAAAGDEVVLASGTYSSSASALRDDAGALLLRGAVVGPDRPVVTTPITLTDAGSRVRDLEVVSGSSLTLRNGAQADRVLVRGTDRADACGVNSASSIRNSLCLKTKDTGSALGLQGDGTSARNVTAIGAANGVYVLTPTTLEASIAKGGTSDLFGNRAGDPGARITFRDVLYRSGIFDTPTTDDGRIDADPVFLGAGDYRQAAGSPTVDAGDLVDASVSAGELDLDGNARRIGAHVDVGAYERVTDAPGAVLGTPTGLTTTSARLNGLVSTGQGRTTWQFRYGTTAALSLSTPARQVLGNVTSASVEAALTGLQPSTTYRYQLVTENDHAETTSTEGTFTTSPLPTVTAQGATAITKTGARLSAIVDTQGLGANVTFEVRAPGRAPTSSTTVLDPAAGPRETSRTFLGELPPGTDLPWTVRITTSGGNGESAGQPFRTLASTVRQASPAGSGATCATAAPCSLQTAYDASAPGDTIVLGRGTYGSAAAPFELDPPQGLILRGERAGADRPVLFHTGLRLPGASSVRDVDLRNPGTTDAALQLEDTGLADRVAASGGADACVAAESSRLTNSLCVNSGGDAAVRMDGGIARNVTADGPNGFEGPGTVSNAIGRGSASGATSTQTLALTDTAVSSVAGAVTQTNALAPFPALSAAYRVPAGASTVDAGDTSLVGAGELDLDGNVRVLGADVDAGAFERVELAPGVVTGTATATTTGATLGGSVTTNGGVTEYHFEYGPTSTYGTSTPTVRLASDQSGPVEAQVTGLPSNRTLHYRIVATNDRGTTDGLDRTTSTRGATPTVSTGTATAVTASAATLPVTVDTKGEAATVRAVVTAPAGAVQTVEQEVAGAAGNRTFDLTVVGLPSGQTITWRAEVQTRGDTERVSARGLDATFATLALPAATTGDATAITATTATLAGTVDTRGLAGTVRFELTPEGGATRTLDQPIAAGAGVRAVSADVTGLPPNTSVSWRVRVETTTATADGAATAFRTLPTAPSATTDAPSAVSTSGATLHGSVDTAGVAGTAWFEVTRDGTTTRTPEQALPAATGTRAVTAELTGLSEGADVTYRLVVRTIGGETRGGVQTLRTATTPPPPPPAVTPTPTSTPAPTPTATPAPARPQPRLTLKLRKGFNAGQLLLSRRTITLFARCGGVACRATGTGIVRVDGKRVGSLGEPRRPLRLGAGERGRIQLRSSARLREAVRRLLAERPRRRAEVVFRATFRGADGTTVRRTVVIRVRQLD